MAADTNDGRMLEQRLRLIEHRFDICNLIASHPTSANTGAGGYTASVWTEGGVRPRRRIPPADRMPDGRLSSDASSTLMLSL
jgi:hypothetical protein